MSYNLSDYDATYDFEEWAYRGTISECLKKFGYQELAVFTMKPGIDHPFLLDCLKLLQQEATTRHDDDVISTLASNGLWK